MTREIKFRAWDNKGKFWYPAETMKDFFNYLSEKFTILADWFNKDAISLEQYTGLKDKNGKEIYEGDIVNLAYYVKPHGKKRWNKTYPHKGSKDIHVVDFEDGYFKFNQEDKDGYGSELAFSDYGEWEGRDCKYKYEAEVIGNIHENPDLLEGGEE